MMRSSQQVRALCRSCAAVPRQHTTSILRPNLLAARSLGQSYTTAHSSQYRWQSTATKKSKTAKKDVSPAQNPRAAAPAKQPKSSPMELADLAEDHCTKFLSVDGIPAEQLTTAALQTCLTAATSLHPFLTKMSGKTPEKNTSKLSLLGGDRTSSAQSDYAIIEQAFNKVSYSAFTIISHPNVEMKPEFLETYVAIQAQLGRPESIPKVFALYAHKRKPVMKNGEIAYVPVNPQSPSRAIELDVANQAVQTAIDARNLDCALGIIESSLATKAFRRNKVLKRVTPYAMGLSVLPVGILGIASSYALYWQNTMSYENAVWLAATGFGGYCAVVISMGLIAKLSYKDQMKRVTWTPGTPLNERWRREEERAALDEVACAWGFKESWRHGEETGPEWEGLKDYMGYRSMLLDRVEFMEGMR